MKTKGLNIKNMKNNNRQLILEILEQHGAMSRKDLAKKINLTPAALTLITTDMLQEKILYQVGEVNENKVGRKKILLDIDYNSRYVIGINFEKNETLIALSNLEGDIVEIFELETFIREEQLEEFSLKIEEILYNNKISLKKISGIGIGMYGYVDPQEKKITINGKEINVVDYFENKFKKTVILDNNVRALALSEMFFYKELSYFLFVKYGPGIGSSIIYNKQIIYGSHDFAGEIGHTIVNENSEEKCKVCGKKGCLENYIDIENVITRIKKKSKNNPDSEISKKTNSGLNIDIDDILIAAKKGEEYIIKELEEITSSLAKLLLNLLIVMDYEKVILYGKIFNDSFFRQLLKKSFLSYDNSFDFNRIEISKDKFFPKDLGAIFLAIKKTFYENGGVLQE